MLNKDTTENEIVSLIAKTKRGSPTPTVLLVEIVNAWIDSFRSLLNRFDTTIES